MSAPLETNDIKPLTDAECAARATGPVEDLHALQRELRNLVHDQLQLAALELRLAAHSLMTMISTAVCIGALLVLSWVGLMAAAGLKLIGLGLQPALVLLLLAALTLALALTLRGYLRQRSRYLGFPGTLRSLKPPASVTQPGETG